ncbi:hypothetical protein F5B20DRAFT_115802 [Whalleya microplaca]|nr:hypothetical protein F5B20DRAFT_115802 [Whalleya microplaca]
MSSTFRIIHQSVFKEIILTLITVVDNFEFRSVVQDALQMILNLLTDSEHLSRKYGGLQIRINDEPRSAIKYEKLTSISKLLEAFKRFKIHDSACDSMDDVKRRSLWVFKDRKKYENLITELRTLIDAVENVTKDLVDQQRQQSLFISRINTISDVRTLNLLTEICEVDHPAFSDAASIRAEVVSMTTTQQANVADWIPTTTSTQMPDNLTEDMDLWDLGDFRQRYLALLDVARNTGSTYTESEPNGPLRRPVDFDQAMSYVKEVEARSGPDRVMYTKFLSILKAYEHDRRPIGDVYIEVTQLFRFTPDLIEGFREFLPDSRLALEDSVEEGVDGQQVESFMPSQYSLQYGGDNLLLMTPSGIGTVHSSLEFDSTSQLISSNTDSVRGDGVNTSFPELGFSSTQIAAGLDMNNPEILKYYTQLVIFRQDLSRQALIFPPDLDVSSIKLVRTLARRLNLSYKHHKIEGKLRVRICR